MTTLDVLRIFGPIASPDVQHRLGCRLGDAVAGLNILSRQGLAARDAHGLWDVTKAGRDKFDARTDWHKEVSAGLRRDAACEGVGR
jgi:hypothetical protein